MTIEQKAKAYDAVLETATKWIKDGCTDKEKICLECVFPELKESDDERIRKWLVDYFKSVGKSWIHRDISPEQIIAYLEKQKEQKPSEWSEEDERRIQRICDFLWKNRKGDTDTIYQIEKDADWLKSLRLDSYKNCNSRWKPSEEQMEALERASTNEYLSAKQFDILVSLREQLEKLM